MEKMNLRTRSTVDHDNIFIARGKSMSYFCCSLSIASTYGSPSRNELGTCQVPVCLWTVGRTPLPAIGWQEAVNYQCAFETDKAFCVSIIQYDLENSIQSRNQSS